MEQRFSANSVMEESISETQVKGFMFVCCISADTDTEEQAEEDPSDRYIQTKIFVIVSPYLYVSEEL